MMNNVRPVRSEIAITCAIIAMALVCAFGAVTTNPLTAYGAEDQQKIAIPALDKTLSAGGAWSKEVETQAGSTLYYSLQASLPEDVAERQNLIYRIIDEPAQEVLVDWSSVAARIETSTGALKARLPVTATFDDSSQRATIMLGDLKETCSELEFGDTLIVEYTATLSTRTEPGTYHNIARLDYQEGDEWLSTVEVEAAATVPAPPSQGSAYDKTGYYLMRFWWVVAIAGLLLISAGSILVRQSRRHSR